MNDLVKSLIEVGCELDWEIQLLRFLESIYRFKAFLFYNSLLLYLLLIFKCASEHLSMEHV